MSHRKHKIDPRRGPGQPDGEDDVINRFGTYEIQLTADTDNSFPMIAQGFPRREAGQAMWKKAKEESEID